jgi:hypothetical protein
MLSPQSRAASMAAPVHLFFIDRRQRSDNPLNTGNICRSHGVVMEDLNDALFALLSTSATNADPPKGPAYQLD